RSHARGGGCLQRTVQPRTALMAEPVSAFGEVAGEGARGQQGATRVRRGPHPVRARAGVRRSGYAEGGAARAVAKTAGPVSTEPQRRVQAATHLLPGESPPESESGAGNGARANARPAGQRPWQNRCAGESRTPGGIPAFPPSRQQTSGYISDVSTTPPTVTFLNGSTGPFTFPPVNPPRRDPVAPGTESVPGSWVPIPSPFLTTSPTRRLPQARRLCLGLGFPSPLHSSLPHRRAGCPRHGVCAWVLGSYSLSIPHYLTDAQVAPGTASVPGSWVPIPSPFLTTSPTRRLPQARRLCLGLGFLFPLPCSLPHRRAGCPRHGVCAWVLGSPPLSIPHYLTDAEVAPGTEFVPGPRVSLPLRSPANSPPLRYLCSCS